MYLKGGIDTGIRYSMSYALWDAAIAAGATLSDLWKIETGLYPKEFLAKIVAWRRGHIAIENHTEAAKAKAIEDKK